MRHKQRKSLILTVFLLVGCATDTPHNEVLIFGTTTKVAIDVAAPVQNAGVPEFTIGYKRNEAVWMPLKPNGDRALSHDKGTKIDQARVAAQAANTCMASAPNIPPEARQKFCLNLVAPTNKYLGKSTGIIPTKGGAVKEEDTYSVFASFGGSGNLSFNNASGNLAQFFATGIAAQRLGANPSVGVALNAGSEAAEAVEASANAEMAKANVEEAKISAFVAGGETVFLKKTAEANLIINCRSPEKNQAAYKKFVQSASKNTNGLLKIRLSKIEAETDENSLRRSLELGDDVRKVLLNQYSNECVNGG